MLKKIIVVSITLSVSAPALAIMGGQEEVWGEHQAAVDTLGCSGSLIAPDIVLTAAHCDKSAEYVKLHDGSYEKVKGFIDHPRYVETQEAIKENGVLDDTHPDYDRLTEFNADIRIVKLENKVKTNEVFKLPTSHIAHAEQVTLWGFGLNESMFEGDGTHVDMLKSAVGEVFDYKTDESAKAYKDVFQVNTLMPSQGSGCFGDSGGSFTLDGTVHGVIVMTEAVDFKDCDETKNADGLYVYDYINWIYDSIDKLSPSESEGILSYPSNVTAGQTIRIQNIGKKDKLVYGSGDVVGKVACSGILKSGEECYLTLPEGNTEYSLSPNDVVVYNHKGSAGSLTEKEYQDITSGVGGDTGGNTGSNTNNGGGGGSTGLLGLLGLGFAALRRNK